LSNEAEIMISRNFEDTAVPRSKTGVSNDRATAFRGGRAQRPPAG
jgi:hypothetical protein